MSSSKEILNLSSENVTKKWLSGKKYIRTDFVKKAFSKFYPYKQIDISILIDAMINILDDILDEELNLKEKALYVIEFLRIFYNPAAF